MWQANLAEAHRLYPRVPPSLPGFLVDRFAYRLYRRHVGGPEFPDARVPDVDMLAKAANWVERTQKVLQGLPSLDIPAPQLDERIPTLPLLNDLLAQWRNHLQSFGIDVPSGTLEDPAGRTWMEFFQASVLYPLYPPAIPGPTFYDRVSPQQKDMLLSEHRRDGILALYIFLIQTHEESHQLQTGSPLLCELVHAKLWCDFLDRQNLWYWQMNEEDGARFNLEYRWLKRLDLDTGTIKNLFNDTFIGVLDAFQHGAVYDDFCLVGWLFDADILKYSRSIAVMTQLFEKRHDREALDQLHQELDRLASTATSTPATADDEPVGA